MFTTLIVQPIFSLLALIYALIPGHNFGLAIIIFTIAVRMLMWPLVKKQLYQMKVMRKLQPELKRIKKEAKGNRRQEQLMMMELYRERGVKPFAQIGLLLIQIPILIGLYIGLQKVIKDPSQMVEFAYPFIRDLGWIQQLAADISQFDETLLGIVDLSRAALSSAGTYWPAMILVVASAAAQYFQSKQLSPSTRDAKSLRAILKEAGQGKQADQSEVSAAMGRMMLFLLPSLIFLFTVGLASALSLYWLVSGLTAYIQQTIILRKDETEMEAIADNITSKEREKKAIEAEIVPSKKAKKGKAAAKHPKRRKK